MEEMNCVPCKVIIDCGALIASLLGYAHGASKHLASAAINTAEGTRAFVQTILHAFDHDVLEDEYLGELAEYSQEACDMAKAIDEGNEPTVEAMLAWKWKLVKLGQEIAGYGDEEA